MRDIYIDLEEFISDMLLFIKRFLYSSDFSKTIEFIKAKIPLVSY